MNEASRILIVGGYGEVGSRVATLLEAAHAGDVVVAGRSPERAGDRASRRIDVDDPASADAALAQVAVVLACVRQREPHLLHAAIRRGLAYTSIAPPQLTWSELQRLHGEAQRTGARIVVGTGLQPGISSILARAAVDRLGRADTIETALLLGVGDAYGADSMGFLVDEIAQPYEIVVGGKHRRAHAFEDGAWIEFPAPVGRRRAWSLPFTDRRYYPDTLGVRTAIARIALDPPWLGHAIAALTRLGLRALTRRHGPRERIHRLTEALHARYADADRFALVLQASDGRLEVRATLSGRCQAQATAAGAAATVAALHRREMDRPGVWLAEQVIDPTEFLRRIGSAGYVPVIDDPHASSR